MYLVFEVLFKRNKKAGSLPGFFGHRLYFLMRIKKNMK